MGRMSGQPRYNIVSARLSDEQVKELDRARGEQSRSSFLMNAVLEKVARDQATTDDLG